jgi:hypothetical protein
MYLEPSAQAFVLAGDPGLPARHIKVGAFDESVLDHPMTSGWSGVCRKASPSIGRLPMLVKTAGVPLHAVVPDGLVAEEG